MDSIFFKMNLVILKAELVEGNYSQTTHRARSSANYV